MLENTDNPIVDDAQDAASLNPETAPIANDVTSLVNDESTNVVSEDAAIEPIAAEAIIEPIIEAKTEELVSEVIAPEVVNEPIVADAKVEEVAAVATLDDEPAETHEDGVKLDELTPLENYILLSQKELIDRMNEVCNNNDVQGNKRIVKAIREAYRQHQRDETASNLAKFKEDGGDPKEFEPIVNPLDETFNDLQKKFNQKVADENKRKERELQDNLKQRLLLIEEVKQIADSQAGAESLSKVHEIQAKWRTVGLVPIAEINTTWQNFNHHVNRYFDGIKFIKELRELDFKKNLELKTALCERAEKFIVEESLKIAIEGVRILQSQWKEIGGTTRESNEIIWQRFTSAIDHVYARQKEYIESKRGEQEVNLANKKEIIVRMKTLAESEPTTNNEWKEKAAEAEVLMAEWKQTGFANRLDNDTIWAEFKGLRDGFYKRRDDHYEKINAVYLNNLKAKTELCIEAERLKESTDWKQTSTAIRKLQDDWKKTGVVQQRHSDKIWFRFRSACDKFYENMKLHFAEADKSNAENLIAKEDLIKRIEIFELLEDNNETIEILKAMQADWMGIGHVPFKEKERLNNAYRKAMDAQFDKVRGRMGEQNKNLFKAKYHDVSSNPKTNDRLREDKTRLQERIKKIQTEIAQQENNISFFAKSKNADSVLKEVKGKIEAAHNEMKKLREQIKLIDNLKAETEKPKEEAKTEE